jgi:hypothetical protein
MTEDHDMCTYGLDRAYHDLCPVGNKQLIKNAEVGDRRNVG